MRSHSGNLPLYFDRGYKKTGASATRYHWYSAVTIFGEYMALNDETFWSKDFGNNLKKGALRLLPVAVVMSLTPGERRSVHSVRCPLSHESMSAVQVAEKWADGVMHVLTVSTAKLDGPSQGTRRSLDMGAGSGRL